MLVFIFKTFTLEGNKEVRLSKDKALQPRKPSGKQLKTIHRVLAAKPYRGQCFRLGKLWQKAAWPLAVKRGSCCCVVGCRFPLELLCYNVLLPVELTEAGLPAKSAHVHLHPALAGLPCLPESRQRAKPFALKLPCISPKLQSPQTLPPATSQTAKC